MSVLSTVNKINLQALTYTPSVIAGVQAAEVLGADATGLQKFDAVVGAVSGQLAGSSNPTVAGIAGLVNLTVLIGNLLGVLKHKTAPVPVPVPTLVPSHGSIRG